ncbi:MAG: type II toxin-antitoxin system HicB family antitoxin [Lachnospiraceae bacterium]|nr:type II toxin-antitoxin system HicB family antitoxin [Lachnospiraceae bacterium]
MSNTMNYKGYTGSVEFSENDRLFYGKVMGVRALISYEGTTALELIQDFHTAIDDYLSLCEEKGIEPEKAYKGSFNVRISPELHREAAIYANEHEMSLNSFIAYAVSSQLAVLK